MSLGQPSQEFPMPSATRHTLWVRTCCGLSKGSEKSKKISSGICIPCWNLERVKKTDTKLRFPEPRPAACSGLWGSPTLQRCESPMCSAAGKARGSTGNEDTGRIKTVFTAEEAGSRREVVTHGQDHHRSRLQPQQRSWGSPCPRKLKPGVTKSSSWPKQMPAPLGRQLAVFQLAELRQPCGVSLPARLPHVRTHPAPQRCPERRAHAGRPSKLWWFQLPRNRSSSCSLQPAITPRERA